MAAAAPAEPDTDTDGMPDAWETFFGLNPASAADAGVDLDADGLTNLQEFNTKGHPIGNFKRYFAEGSTGLFFDTSIGLLNLSATSSAHVSLAFLSDSGVVSTHQVTLAAGQRQTVSVNTVLGPAGGAVATIVESDVAIAADRFIEWGVGGYGSSVDSGVAAPSTSWYIAEGSTGLFQMYYLLMNPGLTPASVTVKFLREGAGPITKSYSVPARSRSTVFVNIQDIGLLAASTGAVITSNVPIVAERSMYFSVLQLFGAGTGGSGVPQPQTTWHFAESATGPFFDEFIALINPSTTQSATATLTFRLSTGVTLTKNYTIAPERRETVYLNLEALVDPSLAQLANASFWTTVTSNRPIAAERVMWWPRGTLWYEGHAAHGTNAPGTSFVVPEGSTGGSTSDQTYILVANTSASAGQVRLTLIPDAGAPVVQTLPIPAMQRLSVNIGSQFGLGTSRFSVLVDSIGAPGVPIVVDYARYSSPLGVTWAAGGAAPAIPNTPPAPVDTAPTVTTTTPANGATDVGIDANITVTFSEPVTVTPTAFTLECPAGTPIALTNTTASPATTFTLDPNVNLPFNTTCTVTVVANQVTDSDTTDPPDNMAANFVFTFTTGSCPNITVAPTSLPNASPGVAYSQQFTQTGGIGAITWSLTGTLPTGIAFDTSTGLLSGTTSQTGSFPITVRATDANGCFGEVTVTLNVGCPTITVGPSTLPGATTGAPFSTTFTQAGGNGAITWSLTGTLPTGVTFNTATGELSGTPTQTGSYPITVRATDAGGCFGEVTVTLTVACPAMTIAPTTIPGATSGAAYTQTFTVTGANSAITWSLTGTLPTGITFNTATGELSGTPTQTGSFPITVTATDANGCSTFVAVTLTVTCPTITVTPTSLPGGTSGEPYTQTFTQVGANTAVTWSLTGTLPTGVTFNTATGELSGTPTQTGSFPVTVRATDANGCFGEVAVTLTVNCPTITVSPSTLPTGTTGTPFATTFTQVGANTAVTWSLTGTLPTGLTFDTNTGTLSGTPTQSGSFSLTIRATDANGCFGEVTVSLEVICPVITVGPPSLPGGTTGTAYPSTQFTQTGGTAPATFSVSSGTLPTGLSMTGSGLLTGTPTDDGPFAFTIQATDANGCTGTLAYNVTIVCPTITVTTQAAVPNGTVGTAYGGVQFLQTGGTTPITWSITAGTLPAGLTLSPTTGQISGTPTATGNFTVTVTATDANGCTGTLQISFEVVCPVITLTPAGPTLTNGTFGLPYSQSFTANGGATPHTFAVTSGTLPTGLTLSGGGLLSGTPTNTGALFNFTITATDNSTAQCTGQAAYQMAVTPNAQDDSYAGAIGNTELIIDPTPPTPTTPTVVRTLVGTLLTNDAGPGVLTVGPAVIPTTFSGSVALAADGTFRYTPAAGFVGPSDSFDYTLTDGNGVTDTGTVTLGVSGIVWYVNSGASNGDGRSHSPFNNLNDAHDDSLATHHVFVHGGGPATPGNITLENGQTLHGHGSDYTLGLLTIPSLTNPTLSGTVTLGPNTTVNTVTFNGSGTAMTGTNAVTGPVAISGVNVTGATTGLSLTNVAGVVTVTNSTFSGISGTDVHVNGGTANVNIGATINNTAGRSVHVQNRGVTGAVTFSGAISDSGTGIRLESNGPGHITHFNGGLTLNTGGNIGLHAISGGTVNVLGATNTITTGAAAALHVEDTTIGAGGLTFQSLSANGAVNGLVLDNTGSTAGLTVTGTGGANSGGTIQNTTSHGVLLSATRSPSFTSFRVMNTGGSGVKGTGVTNFTFVNGSISGSNDDGTGLANEANLAFHDAVSGTEMNLSGTVTITGNSLTNALYHGVDIINHTGTISAANISGNTITSTTSNVTSNGSGIRIQQLGSVSAASHVTNMTINNNIITNFPDGAGIVVHGGNPAIGGPAGQMGQAGNAGAIVNITNNRIAGASGAIRMGVNAIQAAVNGTGQGNFNISGNGTVGNPITNITGNVIVLSSFGTANVTSTIANNVIVANQPNNGGFGISVGSGAAVGIGDTASVSTLIQNNNISQTDGNGIIATAREGNSSLVARILNNTVAAPLNGVRPGIRVDAGAPSSSIANTVCLEISGNTSAGSGGTQGIGLRRETTGTHVFGIEGMAATSSPGVETYVSGQNPAGGGTLLISGTTGFSSCVAP